MERKYTAVLVGVGAAIGAAIYTGVQCELTKSDWAAWVQAAGATVGIGIAIWLPYKQRTEAAQVEENRRQTEVSRLKTAIGEELAGFFKSFYFPFSESLQARSAEMTFDVPLPIYSYNFPVYTAVVDRLTLIPDDQLRTQIADAYRTAENLLTYSRENNRLLEERWKIEAIPNYRDDADLMQRHNLINIGMRGLCSRMRAICGEVPVRARGVAMELGARVLP